MNTNTKCPPGKTLLAYANGKLSGHSLKAVEAHLLGCPLCDAAVEGFVHAPKTTPSLTAIQRMTNETITNSQPVTTPPQPAILGGQLRRILPYLVAAAVSFLLIFSWYNYRQDQFPQRLFAQYFNPVPQTDFSNQRAVAVVRPEMDKVLSQALTYHLDGNYAYALTAWRAFLKDYENQDYRAYLYAANAAMITGKDDLATYYLNEIPAKTAGEFGEDVSWYRALHALKTDGPAAATELLNEMKTPVINPIIRNSRTALLRELTQ